MQLELDTAADQRILTALRTGDYRRAALLLARVYAPVVYKVCYLVSATEADELTHRCFLEAFAGFREFRATGSPRAWLLQRTCETCAEVVRPLWRRPHRPPTSGDVLAVDVSVDPDRLRGLLDDLGPTERGAVGLRICGGLSGEALAALLGLDADASERWLAGVMGQISRGAQPAQQPRHATRTAGTDGVSDLYPSLVEAIRAVGCRPSEALRRRLEVLAAAL